MRVLVYPNSYLLGLCTSLRLVCHICFVEIEILILSIELSYHLNYHD